MQQVKKNNTHLLHDRPCGVINWSISGFVFFDLDKKNEQHVILLKLWLN